MAVKNSVFASKAERLNFFKLSRTWSERYRIYHNLPFLNIFELEGVYDFDQIRHFKMKPLILTKSEVEFLKKTSIDYTLCDEKDTPLVCIEFDGLQDGKNVGTKYYANKGFNPFRQIKLETKLKVALGSLFPYVVVGYSEFEDLDPSIPLTIVDGIIGNIFAGKHAQNRFSQGVTPEDLGLSDSEYKEMHPQDVDELVRNWALGVEIDADFSFNPISKEKASLQSMLGAWSRETRFLYPDFVGEAKTQAERIRLIDESIYVGARAIVDTHDHKNVRAEVWLSNFKIPGLSTTSLLLDIAELLALARLKWLRESGPPI